MSIPKTGSYFAVSVPRTPELQAVLADPKVLEMLDGVAIGPLDPKRPLHCTLYFFRTPDVRAAQRAGPSATPNPVLAAAEERCAALMGLVGQRVAVRIDAIVAGGTGPTAMVAAAVTLLDATCAVTCQNAYPHLTLGVGTAAVPKDSNTMLTVEGLGADAVGVARPKDPSAPPPEQCARFRNVARWTPPAPVIVPGVVELL